MTDTHALLDAVPPAEAPRPRHRVAYLLGAGATQGCVDYLSTAHGLMMRDLRPHLAIEMRALVAADLDVSISRLVNDVVDETTDFEQLITFLEDAPSARHRELAAQLKEVFARVLRTRLNAAVDDLGDNHSLLYAALIDMHEVPDTDEELVGFMTLNYDVFLDHAIEKRHNLVVNHGLALAEPPPEGRSIRVLKLHGSFGWEHSWPVELSPPGEGGLWIPPGIRKAKSDYPFNLIWGLARQMLDCDVLRIIGCNLGPNDWDLVSLLFTTRHAHTGRGPYRIEVISRPRTAANVKSLFPYLDVRSILEVPDIGPVLIGELLNQDPELLENLSDGDRELAEQQANDSDALKNSFAHWLRLKGESLNGAGNPLSTATQIFAQFIEPEVGGAA